MSVTADRLPPGQQLAAPGKWPFVGERASAAPPGVWRVACEGLFASPTTWSLDELRDLGLTTRAIDIHCVTRWSMFGASFRGVPLARLLEQAKLDASAKCLSFVAHSERNHSTSLPVKEALALDAFIALDYEGVALPPEHGGPVRVIVPGKYFYKSVKWLRSIVALAEDRLGFWEATAGYHNGADPWREERFLAPSLTRAEMRQAIESRDFRGRDLRGLFAQGHNFTNLNAVGALLRDSDFRKCELRGANFVGANLSGARFQGADLQRADFSGADVEGAFFEGADLRGANFTGASLFGATFVVEPTTHSSSRLMATIDASTIIDRASLDALAPLQQSLLAPFAR